MHNPPGDGERRAVLSSTPLFCDLKEELVEWVLSRCATKRVTSGEWFVHAGDPSDALYIVLYGRLQVYVGGQPVSSIARGQVFGEMGLVTGRPRTADVRALRESEILVFPLEDFERLADEEPGWMRRVAQVVVDHLVARDRKPVDDQVLTLGVIPVGAITSAREPAMALASALGSHDSVVLGESDAPALEDRARWAHQLESTHRFVIYDGTSDEEDWTSWCVGQSDRLVVVMEAEGPMGGPAPALGRALAERVGAGLVHLLVLHPSGARRPRLARRSPLLGEVPVLNVRRGNAGDLGRAARTLAGRGRGLVLGGGGPRGFAHLGVMRALDEAGVAIDAIGGTSIGAVMGSLRAIDLDPAAREEVALQAFVESGNLFPPTLPVLSFSSARKVRHLLELSDYIGDRLVEETWIPFFCVSANLTKAEVVVHDRGPLATAVRASLSLPGILPPVRWGSDFLVDGGVLNNLPVDIMRQRFAVGSVVAVDVSVDEELRAPSHYRETPSGWALLIDRLRSKHGEAIPFSLNVLMRAKELSGLRAQREMLADQPPEVLIRPDVSGAGMFAFKSARQLIEAGYREAMRQVEAGALTTGS